MKNRGKNAITLAVGILAGIAIAGPTAQAAAEFLKAYPSSQTFYVDGQQVELEAYAIGGYNYVKLRDIGQAVGFNVYYDGESNAAVMEPDRPYTGEAPAEIAPTETVDYAYQANSTIFTEELTREVYNGIRGALINHNAIAAGNMEPIPVGKITPYGDVDGATVVIGQYPAYEIVSLSGDGYACAAKYPEAYQPAAAHTQGFVDGLAGMTDREKVKAIACYVADRITYAVKYPSPGEVLTQDGQVPGACMAYAYSFQFLCDRTGIPCLLVNSDIHQWNKVYVDGAWWDVDVTGFDTGDDTKIRDIYPILSSPEDMQGATYVDRKPNVTAFAKELLVPGSTK